MRVLGLEPQDVDRFLKNSDWRRSQARLDRFELPLNRAGASELLRLDVLRVVPVEKLGHRNANHNRFGLGWDARITTSDDLADEFRQPDPLARVLCHDR